MPWMKLAVATAVIGSLVAPAPIMAATPKKERNVVEFFVDSNTGKTDVRVREGKANVCDKDAKNKQDKEKCQELATPCAFASASEKDKKPQMVEDKKTFKELTTSKEARYFDDNEKKFRDDFQVAGAVSCVALVTGISLGTAALIGGAAAAAAAAVISGGGPTSPAQ